MGIVYYHIFIIVKKHQAARLLYKQSGSMHFNKSNQVQLNLNFTVIINNITLYNYFKNTGTQTNGITTK